MKASLHRFSLPLRSPMETAAGSIERREGVLVRVSGEGASGVGEATPLSGWTEDADACERSLEAAVDRLETTGPDEAVRSLDGHPAARHGLTLALADRTARTAELPLYRHLGAEGRVESVPVNAVIGDGDVRETVGAARDAMAAGFPCLKVKVGARPVDADVRRLEAVRDTVGADITLRADANGAWDDDEARTAFDALAEVGVEYVEQPLAAADLEGHRALRGGPVDVAVDESAAESGIDAVLAAGAADVVVLKPMALGGPDLARSAAVRALDAGVTPVVTTTVDAVYARTAAVHVAASLPGVPACGLATADRLAGDLAPDPAPVRDGEIEVPQRPGTGVEPPDGVDRRADGVDPEPDGGGS